MSNQMFKAWDNKNHRWLTEFTIDQNGTIYIDDSYECGENFHTTEIDATLCIRTGRKVKEKDLFQFDILRSGKKGLYKYHVIEWCDKYSYFLARNIENDNLDWGNGSVPLWVYLDEEKKCEYVGNFFEHKHLLEAK